MKLLLLLVLFALNMQCKTFTKTPSIATKVPLLANYHEESAEEKKFINALAATLEKNHSDICYYTENASYFLEHTVPLHHVYPGKFCGTPSEKHATNIGLLKRAGFKDQDFREFVDEAAIRRYLTTGNNAVVACSGTALGKVSPRFTVLSHGIDAESLYLDNQTLDPQKSPATEISLLFTKFNETTYARPEEITRFYRADSQRKTVLFLPTIGIWEMTDSEAPLEVRTKVLEGLLALKQEYNVIVRPHPLTGPETMNFYRKNFVIAPQGRFPSFVPLYDVADVIIATPSGGGSTATSRPEKPIILLRPRKFHDGSVNMDAISSRNSKFTLNETNTVLQRDFDIDLPARVDEALSDPETAKKIAKRKDYFKQWFGCIDGYEDYRIFIKKILPVLRIPTGELEGIYKTFPLYKNRPLCLT
jgi:hypothetical protein